MSSFLDEKSHQFCLSGSREVVDEDRMKALLAEQDLTEADRFTSIRLSNKSITASAATVLAKELSRMKNVNVVDISDIIAGRPEDEALQTLEIISESLSSCTDQLVELNVSDNALGVKGVNACRKLLTGKSLKVNIC